MSDADLGHVADVAALDNDDDAIRDFNERTRSVYRCDSCGRLHVYWDRDQSWPPTVYAPEPDAYPQV